MENRFDTVLEADYLVIGAGAMGLAFTDVLMTESDASVVIVDRQGQPGGHWNHAYPFVRLHQPSNFYGVNSLPLGSDTIDTTGLNKGLYELACKSEICAYFEQVMKGFLLSGRVRYFPLCELREEGRICSLVSDAQYTVTAGKVVDATYMNVQVPSTREPSYAIAGGVTCIPPNGLASAAGAWDHYVVVGGGKTAVDSCLYLLGHGLNPDRITWIKPRDSWMLDRARVQSGDMFETSIRPYTLDQVRTAAESVSAEDLLSRAAEAGLLLRIDEEVEPTMYRCATITRAELAELRRIRNVVRQGRVQRVEPGEVVLDAGSVNVPPDAVYVDCTADGLERRPVQAVFDGDRITLQSVRTCQQVFSAAFIAHVEVAKQEEQEKNEICTPVPHPDTHLDYIRTLLADLVNGARWQADPALQTWLRTSRLDGFNSDAPSAAADAAFEEAFMPLAMEAATKLQAYLTGNI